MSLSAKDVRFTTHRAQDGDPLLFAGPDALLEPLRDAGAWTVDLPEPALAPIVGVIAARALAEGPLTPVQQAPAAERRRRRVT